MKEHTDTLHYHAQMLIQKVLVETLCPAES